MVYTSTAIQLRRTIMIRRKLSTGILRATKSTGNLRATASGAPIAPAQQNASLASATLLGSQRHWQKETVVSLKSELKARGLSQAGTKSVLISRLESAEATSFLPPVPPMPRSTPVKSRKIATTSTLSQPKSDNDSKTKPESVSEEQVTSTGPQIVSQRSEASKAGPPNNFSSFVFHLRVHNSARTSHKTLAHLSCSCNHGAQENGERRHSQGRGASRF